MVYQPKDHLTIDDVTEFYYPREIFAKIGFSNARVENVCQEARYCAMKILITENLRIGYNAVKTLRETTSKFIGLSGFQFGKEEPTTLKELIKEGIVQKEEERLIVKEKKVIDAYNAYMEAISKVVALSLKLADIYEKKSKNGTIEEVLRNNLDYLKYLGAIDKEINPLKNRLENMWHLEHPKYMITIHHNPQTMDEHEGVSYTSTHYFEEDNDEIVIIRAKALREKLDDECSDGCGYSCFHCIEDITRCEKDKKICIYHYGVYHPNGFQAANQTIKNKFKKWIKAWNIKPKKMKGTKKNGEF